MESFQGVFGRYRYRYGCRYEVTEVSGTGIDAVPKLLKYPVPMHQYRRYRYPFRTVLTEVSGTGIDVVTTLPKCPVPVLMS